MSAPLTRRAAILGVLSTSAAAAVPLAVTRAAAAQPVDPIGFHAAAISRYLQEKGLAHSVTIDRERYEIDLMHGRALPAAQRAQVLAAQLADTLNEINPGAWISSVEPGKNFALVHRLP